MFAKITGSRAPGKLIILVQQTYSANFDLISNKQMSGRVAFNQLAMMASLPKTNIAFCAIQADVLSLIIIDWTSGAL